MGQVFPEALFARYSWFTPVLNNEKKPDNTYIVGSFQAAIISYVFTQGNFSFHLAEKWEVKEIYVPHNF